MSEPEHPANPADDPRYPRIVPYDSEADENPAPPDPEPRDPDQMQPEPTRDR